MTGTGGNGVPVQGPVPVLILAGSRGPGDPVAQAAGVSHKAMVPVAGVPMLVRVVRAVLALPWVGRIAIMIERPELVRDHAELGPLVQFGRLELLPAEPSPSLSVAAGMVALGTPMLVTTADHALLRPEWLEAFWRGVPAGADVAAALARDTVVKAAVPGTRRTYLRFADGAFSGCNMFAFRTQAAAGIVTLWRRVEMERKKPIRLVGLLGPWAVLKFALGRLSLAEAVQRLGQLAGARAAIVEMADGAAAVDVDKPSDLELAERLLAGR